MTITRSQFLSLMEPKLKGIVSDKDFDQYPVIYTQFYDMVGSSSKKKETYFDYAGLGDFTVKNEGGPVTFTDPISGAEISFEHVRFSNGYKVTQEMLDHEQYSEVRTLEGELRRALADFLEVRGHLLLNNAFGTTASAGFSATDFRAQALISTTHTQLDGGTAQSNRPSSDANLDWTSLGNAKIQFGLWKDNRSRNIREMARTLIVHPNDELTAQEVLRSSQKPGTPNNDINALNGAMTLVVTPYLTDTNSWFVKGARTKTVWHWDQSPRYGMMEDWDNEIIKRKVVVGFSHGHLDWRGFYGSSGAS